VGQRGLAQRISALDEQLWNGPYFLAQLRFDKQPFILNVAFKRKVGDT